MQFKQSARVFLTGLILSVVCGVIASMSASAASAMAMQAALNRYSSPSPAPAIMAFVFGLLSLVGFVMVCIGAYRALVKIDALAVPAQEPVAPPVVKPVIAAE